MSKSNPKPATPAAKGESEMLKTCRSISPDFDSDVIRFGLLVAVYNAGWIAGDTQHRRKNKKR